MTWFRQATSHYLKKFWPWSVSSYGVNQPRRVNSENVITYPSIILHLAFICWFILEELLLTHWSLGDLNEILDIKLHICNFQTDFSYRWLRHLLWNCPHMNVNGLHWWLVNISSGNGLVPSSNKPLPEPMLTQIFVAIWCHWATMS